MSQKTPAQSGETNRINQPNQSTSRPSKEPSQGKELETPRVVSIFSVIGDEHRFLPYDPDSVCQCVLDEEAGTSYKKPIDMESVANDVAKHTGVHYPEEVITRAEVSIKDEYVQTDIVALLHLISAHAELLRDGVIEYPEYVTPTPNHQKGNLKQTFKMVRQINVRTQKAVIHFGTALKSATSKSKTHAKRLIPLTDT